MLVAMLSAGTVCAQDLTGDWQGTVTPVTRGFRLVVHIDKANGDAWKATFANIDQGTDRGLTTPANSVTVNGSDFKFTLADGRSYEGKISPDGNSIAGTLILDKRCRLNSDAQRRPQRGRIHHPTQCSLSTSIAT
jgi:hypothetical protein